jgi:hypothetical protein
MELPNIEHAKTSLTKWGGIEVTMEDGYVFHDISATENLTDEDGNPKTPTLEDLAPSKYGVFPPSFDFENRIVVAEEGVNPFAHSPAEATEADYIEALEDLGVNFNE